MQGISRLTNILLRETKLVKSQSPRNIPQQESETKIKLSSTKFSGPGTQHFFAYIWRLWQQGEYSHVDNEGPGRDNS
uniref:Uncharacterized protein n=1 Tax=Magallana gigas TaxID=29159 RepID=K1P7E1_MAGGI